VVVESGGKKEMERLGDGDEGARAGGGGEGYGRAGGYSWLARGPS